MEVIAKQRCSTCKMEKSFEDFHRSKNQKNGIGNRCKVCQNLATQIWRDNGGREYLHGYFLQKKYGLSKKDYNEMFEAQKGLCAICGQVSEKTRLAVDHDHETDEVRELVCTQCNLLIAFIERDIDLVEKAKVYLKRHKVKY